MMPLPREKCVKPLSNSGTKEVKSMDYLFTFLLVYRYTCTRVDTWDSLRKSHQRLFMRHRLPGANKDFCYRSCPRGTDTIFHFHGFDDENYLTNLNIIAGFHKKFHNRSG